MQSGNRQGVKQCAALISTEPEWVESTWMGNMTKKQRRTFDAEFKLQPVQMFDSQG